MPKTLVLFHSRTGAMPPLAAAIAEGARSVRFAEVDIRRLGGQTTPGASDAAPHRELRDADELIGYDGVVIGAASEQGVLPAELAQLLERAGALRQTGALANTVGSAFAPDAAGAVDQDAAQWAILQAMGRQGFILVPPSGTGLDAAKEQGRRVAEVVGWVTHARGHKH
jgi:NAD(P)H dehydrogenase (quinone)